MPPVKFRRLTNSPNNRNKGTEQLQLANIRKESTANWLLNAEPCGSRKAYTDLYRIKPGNSYASQKISAIDDLLAAQVAKKQKDVDDAYSDAMTKGTESDSKRLCKGK